MSFRSRILKKIRRFMEEGGLELLVVVGNENFYYVTGANLTTGLRVFQPVASLIISLDSLYLVSPIDEHDRILEELELDESFESRVFNPLHSSLDVELLDVIAGFKPRILGLELDYLPYSFVEKLKFKLEGSKIVDSSKLFRRARAIKEVEELELIGRASEILVESLKVGVEAVREGVSEREIAAEIEYNARRMGASTIPMINLVASGSRLSHPHPHATDKKVGRGELVMLDVGCTFKMYNADMTRFVSLGPVRREDRDRFEFIIELHSNLVDRSYEGVTIGELWDETVKLYEKHGYLKYLNHPIGRGIGVELVEEPYILPSYRDYVLRENMVLAYNPSLHVPGVGGWRLEDVVVVGGDRGEILTKMPWDIIVKYG